jgi:hypothetical protein
MRFLCGTHKASHASCDKIASSLAYVLGRIGT